MNFDADSIIRTLFEKARGDDRCAAVAAVLEEAWTMGEWSPPRLVTRLKDAAAAVEPIPAPMPTPAPDVSV